MSAADTFFDTNILLYLVSSDPTKAERAERLLADGGSISVQVLNEFAAVATGKYGIEIGRIREVLAEIRLLCSIKALEVETHELGLDLAERYRYSIYDSMILAAALRAGCSRLLSEDNQHGQRVEGLTICNPFIA
jgi:predicted nucleic acid-binding protein